MDWKVPFRKIGLLPAAPTETSFKEAAGITVDDDEDEWRRLSGDTKRDLSPMSQHRMREVAAYLWESNLLANRLVELPLAYLLAEGVSLQVKDADAQATLDRFWNDPINAMDKKLTKRVRELSLFGEACYPAFVNEHSGKVRLGYLDPARIATVVTDPDNPEQPIGIVTVRDTRGVARRYRVIVNGADDDIFTSRTQEIRATFTDGDCFYFTINALSSGVRGRSDLLAQADWLDAYDDFLFGEQDRNKYLRAFVWDVTLKGADEKTVADRAKKITPPAPNSVRVHNDSEEWKAVTPDIKAADSSESARLLRNHVLGGGTMPEHWFGGGGDVNRAAAAEMGGPAFKIFSMRQRDVKHLLEEIGQFVLRQKAIAEGSTEPDFSTADYKIKAVFPEMVAGDLARYAQALQQIVTAVAVGVDKGYLTRITGVRIIASIAGRLGVEIDAEGELTAASDELAAAKAEAAQEDLFTGADPANG